MTKTKSINDLQNKGVIEIGEDNHNQCKTIIIIGCARGGTSVCAGILNELGIYTGKGSTSPIFEDTYLANKIEGGDIQATKSIISKYNDEHKIWAYKRPSSLEHIEMINSLARNPFFIFIFRDIASVSIRQNDTTESKHIELLEQTLDTYKRIVSFIKTKEPSGLIVSYEKLITLKEPFITALTSKLNPNTFPKSDIERATKYIEPNSKEYLKTLNNSNYQGHLDYHNPTKISGWAKKKGSNRQIYVRIYINNKFYRESKASLYREDIKHAGIHPTGECGFEVKQDNTGILNINDSISVQFEDSSIELPNSPQKIKTLDNN